MTHGYDDQGSRFDADRQLRELVDARPTPRASTRAPDKLVEQFDGYEALPGLKVNGKLTLGENIADLGGLAMAYDAMKARRRPTHRTRRSTAAPAISASS